MDIAKLFEGVDPRHLAKGRSDYVPLGWKATPLQLAFSIVPNELVLYGGPLVLSTPVLTPIGFRPLKEIRVGDTVFTRHGEPTKVVDIPFEGKEESYRIQFSDDTFITASAGHKWLVGTSDWRKTKNEFRVKRTKDLLDYKLSRNRNKYYVPQTKPVEFESKPVPLDPYFIGAMLGDGCMTKRCNMTLTGIDREIVDNFDLPEGYTAKPVKGCPQWKFTKGYCKGPSDCSSVIWDGIAELGLAGVRSHTKFIPEEYLFNDVETRLSVLRGLMDTDGTVRDGSAAEMVYCTVSSQLRDDFVFLAQSLGFIVRVSEEEKPPYSTIYRIRLSGSSLCPFRLSRKVKRWRKSDRRSDGIKHIVKITPVGKKKVRCITVEDPDHTFLVRNFTVTKNSAGGGKSEAVLFAAQQYVHIKGYKAIIYRKSYQDLVRSGALLDRAMEWWGPWLGNGIKYIPQDHKFVWLDSGAQVSFGYMGKKGSKDTMQGAEYHAIFIDEVTQHNPSDIGYALSRLRRKASEDIPLRARFTANPGGIGHKHVFDMFKMVKNPNYDKNNPKSPMYIGSHPTHLFIPSRLADNPYIDQESYVKRLSNLDPLTRDRLLHGDWSASPFSRFKPEWFKRYKVNGPYFNTDMGPIERRQLSIFHTIDVAASQKEGVGGRQFYSNNSDTIDVMDALANADPCWTVVATWGIFGNKLFLLDVQRKQTEIPEVFDMMKYAQNRWGIHTFGVEKNGVGAGVVQMGARMGFMVEEIWTHKDKITNSYEANTMANQGNVYIPEQGMQIPGYEWLDDWENEIFTWMGLKDETSDQVDAFSMAAKKVAHFCINHVDYRGRKPNTAVPKVYGVMNSDSSFGSSSAVFNPLGNPFNYE